MTQMESPKRKMQKKNDYQRHKLFRKIKRRRKAQAEAEQQIAEKQLRKKLKLPKFDRGEDDGNYLYKSDIHINEDGSITNVRNGKRYDGGRIQEVVATARKIPTFKDIEKQVGRKITQDEIDKVVAIDPEIPIQVPKPMEKGMYSPSATNEFINTVVGTTGDAVNYLANKAGLPNLAPGEQLIETRDGDALFDLPMYGQAVKFGLYKPYQKINSLLHKPLGLSFLKEYGDKNGSIVGKNLSDKIKEGYFNYTKGQETPLNFDGNYFRATKNMPQVMSEGDAGFKNFPVGEYYSENIDDYYKSVMQPLFDKYGIDSEMRLPRGIITVPENNVAWKGYFDKYSGIPYIKAKAVNGNLIDAIRSGQFNSTYLHEAASHGTDFKIPSTLKEQYRFENFLPSDYKWSPSVKDSKDWQEYRATMNQVRHRLLDTEHFINGEYPSGKELEKAIDNKQMDLIMANFDIVNGYGADYYNVYKDLLNKAKQTNSSRDWQNIINLENHIRNSLKYLPAVVPFAIGVNASNYNSGKDIHIKKSKRGTFTKAAKQHGMSVQGFANKVLKNPSKYSSAMRKKANFARNAASWNH